jgi:hypothetical protein
MLAARNQPLGFTLTSLLCGVALGACTGNLEASDGGCMADPAAVNCAVGDASAETLGLVAHFCTGTSRPDQDPTTIDGVPQGLVCADQGPVGSDGTQAYCCSAQVTPCAYDPVATCDPGTVGYQCRGSDRPEALNAAIHCNQGVRQGDLINYCCSGAARTPACIQSASLGCSAALMGWICPQGARPTAQDLLANQSRADVYYQLCPVPKQADNPDQNIFCCYTPGLVPPGGSCVQDIAVPGCQPGRFGMACYGPDTPDQDYPPLYCPDPGVPGVSEQGYSATLYCCDFRSCVPDLAVPGCKEGRFGFSCSPKSDTPEGYYSGMHCPDPGIPAVSPTGKPVTQYCCDLQPQ